MNRKKTGAQYKYPDSFILGTYIPGLTAADYTTLHKRISKLALQIPIPEDGAVVAIYSTGMKVNNRGEWMRERHGKLHRGWLKVHVAVDVESKKL